MIVDQNLRPAPDAKTLRLLVGVELGGTKCIATLADERGSVLDQVTVPTLAPQETLPLLAWQIDSWCQTNQVSAIGIASFGPLVLDRQAANFGCIAATTKPGWAGTQVLHELIGRWDLPVFIDTDVNGAAAAEMRWGTGRGLEDFAYVTVGTGVGVGLFVNGKSTRGIGHCEMGHIRVPRLPDDPAKSICVYHDDCVEGLASGPAVKAALQGVSFDDADIDHKVWIGVAHAIACLCHALVCTAGPRRIAIGGGVMVRQPHLLARIEPLLRASVNGYLSIPDGLPYVVAPALGDQAGALGPIALACAAIPKLEMEGEAQRRGVEAVS